MSKRLRAEQRRFPPPRPPARLSVLLLSLSWLLLASPRAQGENVDSKLESSRQLMPKDPPKDYEITSPVLLNGEKWRPANSIYSKNHPALLQVVVQAEGKHLVIQLERNDTCQVRCNTISCVRCVPWLDMALKKTLLQSLDERRLHDSLAEDSK